ncbi:MAG: hypothetical protein AAFZ07_19475 [Actinomycetota bacterium]
MPLFTDHTALGDQAPTDGETLMTAPRPLPGRQIGYRAGTGFAVYVVPADQLDAARRLDAEPIDDCPLDVMRDVTRAQILDDYGDDALDAFDGDGLLAVIDQTSLAAGRRYVDIDQGGQR